MAHHSGGINLKNPAELQRAFDWLNWILSDLLEAPFRSSNLTYLEIGLTIALDPVMVLALHRHARHPLIRRETELYYNSSRKKGRSGARSPHRLESLNTVRLHGKNLTIVIYNKRAEVLGKKHAILHTPTLGTRVEVQMKGADYIQQWISRLTGRDLGTGDRLRSLSFDDVYRTFRSIILGFQPESKPTGRPNLATLLALCETNGLLHPSGLSMMEWYRQSVGPRTYQRMRQQVFREMFETSGFSWADVLPEDRLPDLVDVDEQGRETIIRDPWRLTP
ncbi:MAG: hypothetical protein KDM64_09525 [Verrucomicrobiae bacterium]|nr:hypothetical protein [Verrucomicrobiae bacterium]